MLQRPYSFLVVFFLAFWGHISAQVKVNTGRNNNFESAPKKTICLYDCFDMSRMKELQLRIRPEDCITLPINYGTLFNFDFDIQLRLDYKNPDLLKKITPEQPITFSRSILDPAYFSQHLGFVCQKEIQLQKLTTIPVRLRLGSLDYVNYLEQKPNATRPH